MVYVLFPYFTPEQLAQLQTATGRQEKIDLSLRFRQQMADEISRNFPEVRIVRVALVHLHLEIPEGRSDLVDGIAKLTGYVPYPGETLQ